MLSTMYALNSNKMTIYKKSRFIKLKAALPFMFCAALAGCGNIAAVRSFSTAYQAPADGERAKIRIVSNGMVRGVPDSSCVDWRKAGAGVMVVSQKGFANQNNQNLSMPPNKAGYKLIKGQNIALSELYIPASKPFTLSFLSTGYFSGTTKYSCQKSISFVPEAGKNYEAISMEYGRDCLLQVSEASSSPIEWTAVQGRDAGFCNPSDNL